MRLDLSEARVQVRFFLLSIQLLCGNYILRSWLNGAQYQLAPPGPRLSLSYIYKKTIYLTNTKEADYRKSPLYSSQVAPSSSSSSYCV